MDTIRSKSKKNYRRKIDKSPIHKKQRLDSPPDDEDGQMKITELIDDCLVNLFEYLDADDLLNVAVACNYLVPAAADVFKRKFGKKEFVFNECDDFRPNTCGDAYLIRPPKERSTSIVVYGLKASLLYLRHFGASIRNLTIDYYKSKSIRYAFVHQYISTYCSDSLIGNSFMRLPDISVERFEKPLAHVRHVVVCDSDLGKQLASCGQWFPSMRHLKLTNVRLASDFDRTSFRHLKHLCACLDDRVGLKTADLPRLLHSNQRLRSLEIEVSHNSIAMNTLLHFIKDLSKITKLHVRMLCEYSNLKVPSPEVNRIVNEHKSLVQLHLPQYQFQVDDVIQLICHENPLQSFHFRMKNQSSYGQLDSKVDRNEWTLTKVYDWDSDYVKLDRRK